MRRNWTNSNAANAVRAILQPPPKQYRIGSDECGWVTYEETGEVRVVKPGEPHAFEGRFFVEHDGDCGPYRILRVVSCEPGRPVEIEAGDA